MENSTHCWGCGKWIPEREPRWCLVFIGTDHKNTFLDNEYCTKCCKLPTGDKC